MPVIRVQTDCDNAPKKAFLKDFEVAFAESNGKKILEMIDENIIWEMVGQQIIKGKEEAKKTLETMLDNSIEELIIENIITHGDTGAVNGTMRFTDGSTFAIADIVTFTSHAKDAKIKKLTSFVIEAK